MLRACAAAAVTLALAACSGMGMPGSSSGSVVPPSAGAPVQQAEPGAPMHQADADTDNASPDGAPVSSATGKASALLSPAAGVTTCATSPPQYQWIFKGACEKFTLKSTGAAFSLQTWDDITVKGSIGANNLKAAATVYLADATDSGGDIETYKGKSFDKYKAEGTTFIYAVAVNQGKTAIKPVAQKNKPILQYVITDSKGLPGTTCGAAVLTTGEKGSLQWETLPGGPFKAKGKTVTITQYSVPQNFELPPQTPLYFAVNCFK
ncbi:MAG: hypothetical protein ACLQHL_01650 [Candidatus Cybelea sp.]|jgi:hypothetical protein